MYVLSSLVGGQHTESPAFFVLFLVFCAIRKKFAFLQLAQPMILQTPHKTRLCSVKCDALRSQFAAIHGKVS